mmetsp:Transcript_23984/g.70358  ORF Transcript_23984/g.70358 Transcript_23984/m.70358 type:complete len:324 (-) Transcript_23984:53-1024(-)
MLRSALWPRLGPRCAKRLFSQGSGDTKELVLKHALAHVPNMGWTNESLACGAVDAGLPAVSHGVVSRGPVELVEYFMESAARSTAEDVRNRRDELFDPEAGADAKLKAVMELRLRLLIPYLPHWPQAMALGLLPQNIVTTARNLALLSDEICYAAGLDEGDLTWYTHRTRVVAVYSAAEVFMLTDESADFTETWEFLERRLATTTGMDSGQPPNPQALKDLVGTAESGLSALARAAGSVVPSAAQQIIQSSVPGRGITAERIPELLSASVNMGFGLLGSLFPQGHAPQRASDPYTSPPPTEDEPISMDDEAARAFDPPSKSTE